MTMAGDKERYHRDHSLAESLQPIDHLLTQILKENQNLIWHHVVKSERPQCLCICLGHPYIIVELGVRF